MSHRNSTGADARLPDFGRSAAGTLGARIAMAVAGVVALVLVSDAFDRRVAIYAAALPPDAVAWGSCLSELGKSGYMFALSSIVALGSLAARTALKTRRFDAALTLLSERAAYVFTVLAVSGLAAQIIKHLVGRARPRSFQAFGAYHFDVLSMKNTLASFPSGHSTTAFAMAVALSLILPRYRVALFTLAIGIALSRIVVQAHYVSDIAAGSALGAGTALLVATAFARRAVAFSGDPGHRGLKGDGVILAALTRDEGTSS